MSTALPPLSQSDSLTSAGIPLSAKYVLLGECTHGTEEFYRTRAAITRRLVAERGFTAVVFEADWPDMEGANEYVKKNLV